MFPICLLVFPVSSLVTPGRLQAQTSSIRLERITYLTANLDSTMRSFLLQGFSFGPEEFAPYGPVTIRLPSGESIDFVSSSKLDTSDWKARALAAYGDHVAGVSFAVDDVSNVLARFDSLAIPHGPLTSSGFGLRGIAPLDMVFVPRDGAGESRRAPITPTGAPAESNSYRRISWLLLTASDSSQALLRRVFDALGLRKQHEGCCDYWLIGPVDARTAVRFEIPLDDRFSTPSTRERSFVPEGEWLSIEDGGIVYGY
ncbi:MAG: hypothetical protein Q8922_13500 [Bacteroidota bacterium]|nr:hypothetical protein [Bacteroidota bacterium]